MIVYSGQLIRGFGPQRKKKNNWGPSKGEPAKNLYSKSEKLTLSCSVIWAWSETVYLYNRQIMIISRKTKTSVTQSALSTLPECRTRNFYRLLPPLDGTEYFGRLSCSVLFIKFEGLLQSSLQPEP